MNNKGMTLVELIITFSLLMVIIIGMFNLILDAKMDLDQKQIIKNVAEYSDFLNNDIHYDLIRKKPFAIAIKQSESSNWTCTYNNKYEHQTNCAVNDSTLSVDVTGKNEDDESLHITGSQQVDNICNNYYPCAVYAYYNQQSTSNNGNATASFMTIALNNDKTKEGGYGLKYNNKIENIPDQKYININKMDNITMKIDNKGFFIIEYPIYIIDENGNYGFKIIYPFNDNSIASSPE